MLDHATVEYLRSHHSAWRLLLANNAPLIVSFLDRAFIQPNHRVVARSTLLTSLEDELFALRNIRGDDTYPLGAARYLDEWAEDSAGWLRKFYPTNSDEPHYDLTPATEKAIRWLHSLSERKFVGTESRLMTVFNLLKDLLERSELDPELRIAELEQRRAEIDREMARIRGGDIRVLDDTEIKDQFQQAAATANELLGDFREVEHNFRQLDRQTRERIAKWERHKGELLEQIFGERDVISDSDQGRSFTAFWEFLQSPARQEELTRLLDGVLALPAVQLLAPDQRLRDIHYDWLAAGEHTQNTVRRLSGQLRRFLDDRVREENARIDQLIGKIVKQSVGMRELAPKQKDLMSLPELRADVQLPMERKLFSPQQKLQIVDALVLDDVGEVPTDALFSQVAIDKLRLDERIRLALAEHDQVRLSDLLAETPLQQGLAELVAWLWLAHERPSTVVDETHQEAVNWPSPEGVEREATMPRVILVR